MNRSHIHCEQISDDIYLIHSQHDELEWHCKKCKAAMKDVTEKDETISELEKENEKLKESLEELRKTLKNEIKEEILNEL